MSVRPIQKPPGVATRGAGDHPTDSTGAPSAFREPLPPAQRSARLQPLMLKEPEVPARVTRTFAVPKAERLAPPRIRISAELAQRLAGPRLSIVERNGELFMFNRLNHQAGNAIMSFGPSAGLTVTATAVDERRTSLTATDAGGRSITYVVDMEARRITAADGRSATIAHSLDELMQIRAALRRGDPEAMRLSTLHKVTPGELPALGQLYDNDRSVLDGLEYIEVRHGIAGVQGAAFDGSAFVREGAEAGVVVNELSHAIWSAIAQRAARRHAGEATARDGNDASSMARWTRMVFLGRGDIDKALEERTLDGIERRHWFQGYRLPHAAYRDVTFADRDSADELCSDVASILTNDAHLYRVLSYGHDAPTSYAASIAMARAAVRELNAARPRSRQISRARLDALLAGDRPSADLRRELKLDATELGRLRGRYLDVGRALVSHFRTEVTRAYPPRIAP